MTGSGTARSRTLPEQLRELFDDGCRRSDAIIADALNDDGLDIVSAMQQAQR